MGHPIGRAYFACLGPCCVNAGNSSSGPYLGEAGIVTSVTILLHPAIPVLCDTFGGALSCEEITEFGDDPLLRCRAFVLGEQHNTRGCCWRTGCSCRTRPGPRAGASCFREEPEEPQARGFGPVGHGLGPDQTKPLPCRPFRMEGTRS